MDDLMMAAKSAVTKAERRTISAATGVIIDR